MARTVLTAADRIEEKYGGDWKRVGKEILKPPPSIPTGSLLLNEAIGQCKGWPEGAIVEAFGPQHSGKTLLGYLAIAASQKAHPDRDHLIIDAENQFKFQASWAQQVGVDVENLFVTGVTSAEEAFDKMEMAILGKVELDSDGNVKKILEPGNFGVILIDSVTQLVPLEMVHKSMEESTRMALLASVMSHGLKKIVSAMTLAKSKTVLFFVNQTRADPGKKFGNKETRTGGTSLPFYDTIAVRVAKVWDSEERDKKGKIFAHQVKIKFEKNKAGQLPANPIIFRLRYDGTGIDNDFEMISVAEMNGILVKLKRGQYNFVKPGTEELLDSNIENFSQEDFKEVIDKNKHIKEMILKFIEDGNFYSTDEIKEDIPDTDESDSEEKADKKIKEVKVDEEEIVKESEQQKVELVKAPSIEQEEPIKKGRIKRKVTNE